MVSSREWRAGSPVRIVHVLNRHGFFASDNVADTYAAETALAEIAYDMQVKNPSLQVTHELLQGSCDDAILEAAERWGAEMIVVGCSGHSKLENIFLGSVSRGLVERATCPVLVGRDVPENARGNILVAVEESSFSAAAIEWLMHQYWARNANIGLISVIDHAPVKFVSDGSISQASRSILAWENLKYLTEYRLSMWSNLIRQFLPESTVYYGVLQGEPKDLLVRSAANWPAEVVVMGSHGRRGLSRLVLGSVSDHMAANAPCAVEIVRGKESEHFEQIEAAVASQNTLANVLAARPKKYTDESRQGAAMGLMGSGIR
jgi:nucleotide-binding universal stress UspA family protein